MSKGGEEGKRRGTITRRKNGGGAVQYYVHTVSGRKRRSIYGKTREKVGQEAGEGAL